MLLLKVVTILAMGFLALAMVRLLADALNVAMAKVKAKRPAPRTRLVQDPRTGIYHPEQ